MYWKIYLLAANARVLFCGQYKIRTMKAAHRRTKLRGVQDNKQSKKTGSLAVIASGGEGFIPVGHSLEIL